MVGKCDLCISLFLPASKVFHLMKIKLKTMQISFLLCHKFSFYHTSIPISKVEIWSPFPVMYVGRYSHTCILSVNLHREFTTIVAKPCSCCFPTYFSCYCNYETSRYICIPKDQNSAACAAFPGLQPSFSITSCDVCMPLMQSSLLSGILAVG